MTVASFASSIPASFLLRRAESPGLPAIMSLEFSAFPEGERDELQTYQRKISHVAGMIFFKCEIDAGCWLR